MQTYFRNNLVFLSFPTGTLELYISKVVLLYH